MDMFSYFVPVSDFVIFSGIICLRAYSENSKMISVKKFDLDQFSSPEQKAHGELIVYQSSRCLSVCPCVRPCVNTFKYEYFHNQQANHNQIITASSLGWGNGCNKFWARSDQNSGFHGNR